MTTVTLCLLFIFVILHYPGPAVAAGHWSYGQTESWQGLCQNGKEQSPIALSNKIAEEKEFPSFIFEQYKRIHLADMKNNGHSVEVRFEGVPNIRGGGLPARYFLDHLHFHWDSEHAVNGIRFPLELHLVHYATKHPNLAEALKHQGDVAVLAVLFYLSPENDIESDPLFNYIENIRGQNQVLKINLNIDDYLPRDKAGFFRYNGSLTTPPCAEGVIWTVFTNPIPISRNQAQAFALLQTEEKQLLKMTYRPLQSLNGRKVFLKSSGPLYSSAIRSSNLGISQIVFILIVAFIFFK